MEIFTHPAFKGKTCFIDADFVPFLKQMGDKATELILTIYINQSYRSDPANVPGAIVHPAKMSNHLVGMAIDCNIIDGQEWLNTLELIKDNLKAMELINFCKSIGMRWGGDFQLCDRVHFDTGLNINNPILWHQKFNLLNKISVN